MKKNISINISGIIFHIEEDGYEQLKNYLDSINKYFSSFDENKEIIADIESRIAEIFLSKLNEGKQVITLEDVESLIATMGSVEDFQAMEEPEPEPDPFKIEDEEKKEKGEARKLYRDSKRRLLGGVAAGIAHYFSIDPLWIRLIFIVLAFDLFITATISGVTILGYIILWIVLPESESLPDDQKLKKMYRNPEDRVIGGVCSGIAAYFGTDVVIIRLILVISIFLGGAGVVIYLILWIILPEAKTITEKVQMKGDPVTLENIETSIKNSLNVKDDEEESPLVKILLFPFRLIAIVLNGLARILGPVLMFLVEAIRVIFGIALSAAGVLLLIALAISLGILLGFLVDVQWLEFIQLPLDTIKTTFPTMASIAAFVSIAIPAIGLILLGIIVISKSRVGNATVGWSLFALWIISLIALSFTVPRIAYQFRTEGVHKVSTNYDLGTKTAILTLKEVGMDDYEGVTLRLRGWDGNTYKLVQEFEARGVSRQQAIENAQMVTYHVGVNDSVFIFDSNISFEEDARFRGQTLDMILYIPYYHKFMMEEELKYIIRSTINRYGYRVYEMEGNTWQFTPKGLECITCNDISEKDNKKPITPVRYVNGYHTFPFENFTIVDISNNYLVRIEQGEEFEVRARGNKEGMENMFIDASGDILVIRQKHRREIIDILQDGKRVELFIRMPELKLLNLKGTSRTRIMDFTMDKMQISLSGASDANIHTDTKEMVIDISGASRVKLKGEGNILNVSGTGASLLDGRNFHVEEAHILTKGTASATVDADIIIQNDRSFFSELEILGQTVSNWWD